METTEKTTAEVLKGMLTENTGSHFLDSGGAYGRNHERNQGRDFESEKGTGMSFQYGEIEVCHNTYHWLLDRLEYAPEEDRMLQEFAELPEHKDKYWPEIMEDFPQYLAEKTDGGEPGGMYGEGEPFTVNTYNGEDMLSQTLQYTYFTTDHGTFVMLQIHGGCDVRGGYTAPRIFTEDGSYDMAMFDNARATIWCKGDKSHAWSTSEAGYHWEDCSYQAEESKNLEDFELVNLEDAENFSRREIKNGDFFEDGETTKIQYSHQGVLVIDEDKDIGYCPHCGAELEAGF